MSKEQIFNLLFTEYDKYKENKFSSDYIKHSYVISLLNELRKRNFFKVESLGKSVEGREIFSVVFGSGKIKILAWSQMHGDEPTATAALFDLINFFSGDDSINNFRNNLLDKITFHFIPMLNPDGAYKFKRENSFNIDLNRDALRLQSYESTMLNDYSEKNEPEFAFNLHDQNSYYTAGRTNKTAAISVLAPPMDYVKSINYSREKSMQIITQIFETLSVFIPGQIARYKDDHEPRSFGDNFMKKNISTILIESGFYKGDLKKDFVRKLNFIALLSAFKTISDNNFEKFDYTKYFDIPINEELLFDLLLRNLTLNFECKKFKIDIGIKREKFWDDNSNSFNFKGTIAEIGDLSIFYGIEEFDLSGCQILSEKMLAVDDKADFKISKNGKVELKIVNGFPVKQ